MFHKYPRVATHRCLQVALCYAICVVSQTRADYTVEQIGPALVVYLRGPAGNCDDLRQALKTVHQAPSPSGKSFAELYGWAPELLANAFDVAERAHGGTVGSVTRGRRTRLVIFPHGFPSAGTNVSVPDQTLTVFISSGMIDFVENIGGALLLDAHRSRGDPTPAGIGLEEWLKRLRSGQEAGPDLMVAAPGPRPPLSREWLVEQWTASQTIYSFIFAHELAHLTLDQPSRQGEEALPAEIRVDREALRVLLKANVAMPLLVVDFDMGLWYYQKAKGPGLRELFKQVGSPETFDEMAPAANWPRRAAVIVDDWEHACREHPDAVYAKPGWQHAVADCRSLIAVPFPAGASAGPRAGDSKPLAPTDDEFGIALRRMIDDSEKGFPSLRAALVSKADDEDKVFESTVCLLGARRCRIWIYADKDLSPSLRCEFDTGEPDEAVAAKHYLDVVERVRAALPEGWTVSERESQRATKRFTFAAKDAQGRERLSVTHTRFPNPGQSNVTLTVHRPE